MEDDVLEGEHGLNDLFSDRPGWRSSFIESALENVDNKVARKGSDSFGIL